jgi:hypothetical protein
MARFASLPPLIAAVGPAAVAGTAAEGHRPVMLAGRCMDGSGWTLTSPTSGRARCMSARQEDLTGPIHPADPAAPGGANVLIGHGESAAAAKNTASSKGLASRTPNTPAKTPPGDGTVARDGVRDAYGNRRSSCRASSRGCACSPLPRGRGAVDRPDRRSTGALACDDQGLLLRPRREEGARGEGPLPGGVPRLRRVHAIEEWERGRLRVLQDLPPGRDRAALDASAGA